MVDDANEPVRGEARTSLVRRILRAKRKIRSQCAHPITDHGSMPNLKWSFADSHVRIKKGGWTRGTTVRELPIAKDLAGVNMRLVAGAVRELHWHKQAEWSYMLRGQARITAVDEYGRTFADHVREGDLWYFPAGIPHSIQGLAGDVDGCEFLLVFDDGSFSEENTFLLTDWLAHTPCDVVAKNLAVPEVELSTLPQNDLYIFRGPEPGDLEDERRPGMGPVPQTFSYRLHDQTPSSFEGGTVRIVDSSNFGASKPMAAALVELEPGAMRELHWHPNADEWQYFIQGEGRMTVFGSESTDVRLPGRGRRLRSVRDGPLHRKQGGLG